MTEETSESPSRLLNPEPPSEAIVSAWLGKQAYSYWQRLGQWIDEHYPDVFNPEWLYGGKKHGWSLRYKKSKSFCTFVPEKNRFLLVIVFGKSEREKVDALQPNLSKPTQSAYDAAPTYTDGKWLLLEINSLSILKDVELLLSAKRKPKSVRSVF
ncbi:DUF3788 domain-containing protein [Leptonema illini]|uniref:DUF3788 domain-containing protein n=1 Tax=Leptonema illini DSM 21528 TaxID=929563 RepID=H2CKE3_9LEPT|nr:DUF3788 domain-containing protein [Leptonema illini]EHQ08248.1 hypothetical protein Lepil_3591 [Leptonema illini DSM 21528]